VAGRKLNGVKEEQQAQDWADELAAATDAIVSWRRDHPRASLEAIEDAVDEGLGDFRARLLAKLAMESERAEFAGRETTERPRCGQCGTALLSRGPAERRLLTSRGREVVLKRSYGWCRRCREGFFPPG
jgi:hypothetical protein